MSPCQFKFLISSPLSANIQNIVAWYLYDVFKCSKTEPTGDFLISLIVPARTVNLPLETSQEKYSLVARVNSTWEIRSEQYSGFIRGLQTFFQLFQLRQGSYYVQGLPIVIDDQPNFKWRGIMIDSSRHFLSIATVKKTIDALMFNKMNILHWHIIDEDSFTMQIPDLPQLSQAGKIGGTYTQQELKDIVSYAKDRGVRVVVEIDTPAHTDSWGRSDKLKSITVNCNGIYSGQFDPTLDLTYNTVQTAMKYADSTFEDPYIHFGGDQVQYSCWDKKPSIKDYMKKHNIDSYLQLSKMYRQKQKKLWRKISSSKRVIYWANEAIDLPVQSDDAIQWWGLTTHLDKLAGRHNQVILSNYDQTYLDVGFGNRNGRSYRTYINWRDLYQFSARFSKVNIIGGQTAMWSQLSNVHTHDQKIWIRSSVLAQRLWNDQIAIHLADIGKRLVAQSRRMKAKGYKTSPVTVQICEENIEICF